MSPLEKAARAAMKAETAWNEGDCDEPWGVKIARAVLLAVKVDEPVYMPEQRFNERIDAILGQPND